MARLRLVRWQDPAPDAQETPQRVDLRGLVPARRPAHSRGPNRPFSFTTLVIAVSAHAAMLLLLLSAATQKPAIEKEPAPMLVSLISSPQAAPEPEVVPIVPEPPKPEPVVKKQKPQPVPQLKPVPQPQPQVEETTPPAAITQEQTQVEETPAPPAVAQAPEVEKAPEPAPEPEPVLEPPRFGIAYLNNPKPPYPPLSKRMGEEGRVILRVLVNEKGEPESVEIQASSGSPRLDQAALTTVKKSWRFVPAKRNNVPIKGIAAVPVDFAFE